MSRPYKDLVRELKRYTWLVNKQKGLLEKGHVTDRDVDFIYEIAFLSAYVSFEVFIERQFEALLAGKNYYRGRVVRRRLEIRSERVAREVIKGRNVFPKYLPVEELEKLARIFFSDGKPFTLLTLPHKNDLAKGQSIRNFIAHRSRSAREKFEGTVLSGVSLRPSKRTPAGFLRSPISSHQDRFEQMIGDLSVIAQTFVK